MLLFLIKRLATLALTLMVASVVVFAVLELLPGNVAELILGDTATPESLAALQAKLGLDRPPLQRYLDWVGGLARGETASSISYDTPTAELIAERLRVTLPLAVLAMLMTVVLSLSLGLYAASPPSRSRCWSRRPWCSRCSSCCRATRPRSSSATPPRPSRWPR